MMIRCTAAFFCCILLLGKPGFAQSSAPRARSVIDLGASPWKFKKMIHENLEDTLALRQVQVSGETLPQEKVVELAGPLAAKRLRNQFSDLSIEQAFYKIEGSADKLNWTLLSDKTGSGEPVSYQAQNDVKSAGNTVGLVENRKTAYIDVPLNGNYKFLRLTLTRLQNSERNALPKSEGKLMLYGSDGSPGDEKTYGRVSADDQAWQKVGVPHCFNEQDTYPNSDKSFMWKGTAWYRKHFRYDRSFSGKKIFLEFDGVNVGAAVYVNGKFKPGNTAVKQAAEVTHVGGYLPFSVDITDDVLPGADNVIAVKVSNAPRDFFTWPGFGVYEGFGMGWGGIVCPVRLYAVNKVFIPLNSYSPNETWGTYNAVLAADAERATVRLQTNARNDETSARKIALVVTLLDANRKPVKSMRYEKVVPAGSTGFFDNTFDIARPQLWFPNNSPFGKPYLYTLVRKLELNGRVVDEVSEKLGLRTITWDADYCYVNGKKHLLNGFGNRNIYPGLGSAVPKEIQWKDIQLIADAGGNALRVGHVPATRQTLEACDAYGIVVMNNSGDNEWSLKNEPANTYKPEYDRDMIVNFRNYTCIAIWESNNGIAKDGVKYEPSKTLEIAERWDSLQRRIVATRDRYPPGWDKSKPLVMGYTNRFEKVAGSPSLNTEVYGAFWDGRRSFNIARNDYENEKAFSRWYVDNWLRDIGNKACGWIDWMLAETQGEGYTIYLNGKSRQRSLGSSAMDGNRFPKLKYRIYKNALWVPFETRPGVALQSTWNLSGPQTVDAWSNCPQTELFLNGKSLGKRAPDLHTRQITWENIAFTPGKLKIIGLNAQGMPVCADSLVTAGKPHRIVLTVEKHLRAPDGSLFRVTANGSDAALIRATVVDKDGNWCPDADNNIRFEVRGDADYKGSYNFYVDPTKPVSWHSPGDAELAAEGGLMKIAVRSRFTSGAVTVRANADGLLPGSVTYLIQKVSSDRVSVGSFYRD